MYLAGIIPLHRREAVKGVTRIVTLIARLLLYSLTPQDNTFTEGCTLAVYWDLLRDSLPTTPSL